MSSTLNISRNLMNRPAVSSFPGSRNLPIAHRHDLGLVLPPKMLDNRDTSQHTAGGQPLTRMTGSGRLVDTLDIPLQDRVAMMIGASQVIGKAIIPEVTNVGTDAVMREDEYHAPLWAHWRLKSASKRDGGFIGVTGVRVVI